MYHLYEDVEGGVYMKLRKLVLWSLPDDYSKGYCHHRRDNINSSLQHVIIKGLYRVYLFTSLEFSQLFSSSLSSRLTSSNLIQNVFSKEECNFTLIKIPSSPSFIPSENDISQNVILSTLHFSSLAQGGIILLVK